MLRSRLVLATFLVVACAACSQESPRRPRPPTHRRRLVDVALGADVLCAARTRRLQRAGAGGVRGCRDRVRRVHRRNDEFYAAGETTVAAKHFYQRYAVDWSTAWGNLAQIANSNVTVTGSTKTVWTKPKSIELDGSEGDTVVLRQLPRRVGPRRDAGRQGGRPAAVQGPARLHGPAGEASRRGPVALWDRGAGLDMLTRALGTLVAALVLPLVVAVPRAAADGDSPCPAGTEPVSVGSGVICVVVTDPGQPGQPGEPGEPGGGGQAPAGCYKNDGTEVPCQTDDGYWWPGYQCYAAPYDAPPGTPAWQGHTDGSLWQCTRCDPPARRVLQRADRLGGAGRRAGTTHARAARRHGPRSDAARAGGGAHGSRRTGTDVHRRRELALDS